jgi:undecaprenyl diphosphate synthase
MLWQITGSKVFFTERTWPDFDSAELDLALTSYANGLSS